MTIVQRRPSQHIGTGYARGCAQVLTPIYSDSVRLRPTTALAPAVSPSAPVLSRSRGAETLWSRERGSHILRPTVAASELTWNSSLTRVRPFFDQLITGDPTGEEWLSAVVTSVSSEDQVAERPQVRGPLDRELLLGKHHKDNRLGVKVWMRRCFEYPLLPTRELLEYCLRHPEALKWPEKGGRRDEDMGDEALTMRKALLLDEPPGRAVAQGKGLALLDELGPGKAARKWWAFEGATEADCVLRAESYTLLVEGKRTEDLSEKTRWLPRRNQLARNLEAAGQMRHAGVLLAVENLIPDLDVKRIVQDGCPHLDATQHQVLCSRFLGQVTWRDLCRRTGIEWASLPDTIGVVSKGT